MSLNEIISKVDAFALRFDDDRSSMISELKWRRVSDTHGELCVTFKANDSMYKYVDVPSEVFCNLIKEESVGKYFCKHIKNVYEFERIEK